MLLQIVDGTLSLGGRAVLSHIDFEIRGTEKIAVTGRNGAGKTSLLRLLAGELTLDRDDRRQGPGILNSRRLTVGYLGQQAVIADETLTLEQEILKSCPAKEEFSRDRFDYERNFDIFLTGLGFDKKHKKKQLSQFSGGELTKIGLIRVLLAKPEILLLDEPTNHLDLATAERLEEWIRNYEGAVVMVSHDRFFLDQTAEVVYELENHSLTRYVGNYSDYRLEKRKKILIQSKVYERQEEERKRLEGLVERFKHKPTKASFARSKKKAIERMGEAKKPQEDDVHIFTGEMTPEITGSKLVLEAEHLKLGYDKVLLELSVRIRRGQKIGILGQNGAGKSTFLKTAAGLLKPLGGTCNLGRNVVFGYFDQYAAQIQSDKTVADHFHDLFPALTKKEVYSLLGAYLFGGKDAGKQVCSLSGGEKARLVLAELLQSRPNFLILDEPTNHMDIQARETLESAFLSYKGTLLFVSHDRYFIRQVADAMLIFEGQTAAYYPFGYAHYLEHSRKARNGEGSLIRIQAEEAAMIAGLRAVPRAERHRLSEVPAEEAYLDWQLRLVEERMEMAGEMAEVSWQRMEEARSLWLESEEYWNRAEAHMEAVSEAESAFEPDLFYASESVYRLEEEKYRERWERYHEQCLSWYETAKDIKYIWDEDKILFEK